MTLRKRERILGIGRGNTRSQSIERPLCKRPWTYGQTENGLNDNTKQFLGLPGCCILYSVYSPRKRKSFEIRIYFLPQGENNTCARIQLSRRFLILPQGNRFIFQNLMLLSGTRQGETNPETDIPSRETFKSGQ
jgi:hypothetical protein